MLTIIIILDSTINLYLPDKFELPSWIFVQSKRAPHSLPIIQSRTIALGVFIVAAPAEAP